MAIVLPSPASVLTVVGTHPVVVLLLLIVVGVVLPAVWSRQPDRRCAGAAVLAPLLTALIAVSAALPAVLTAYRVRMQSR